jgi:hypothetical protein
MDAALLYTANFWEKSGSDLAVNEERRRGLDPAAGRKTRRNCNQSQTRLGTATRHSLAVIITLASVSSNTNTK